MAEKQEDRVYADGFEVLPTWLVLEHHTDVELHRADESVRSKNEQGARYQVHQRGLKDKISNEDTNQLTMLP